MTRLSIVATVGAHARPCGNSAQVDKEQCEREIEYRRLDPVNLSVPYILVDAVDRRGSKDRDRDEEPLNAELLPEPDEQPLP